MIKITSDNIVKLYLDSFNKLYASEIISYDPKLLREQPALLTLEGYTPEKEVKFDSKSIISNFDYAKYVVDGNEQMDLEIKHYEEELIKLGKIKELLRHFKANPLSKRAILNLWDDKYLDYSITSPCLTYAWFRNINGSLEMHCHMRANDAYKILLMDLHILTSLQKYVASEMNLKIGKYFHIVDSLHLYKRNAQEIENFNERNK